MKIPGQIFLGTNRIDTAIRTDGKQGSSMAARVLQKFKPTLPEKFKGGKLEKIGRILFYFI